MATVKSILLPTDFSEASDAALRYAVDMAQGFGAQLFLLHVPDQIGEGFEANFPVGRFETAAREQLNTFLTEEEVARLKPEYALRVGSPAEEIVHYAEARDIELIIMGTHGRTGMAHLLMGSVAEHVVRMAPCPVLLVRHHKPALVTSQTSTAAKPAFQAKPTIQ